MVDRGMEFLDYVALRKEGRVSESGGAAKGEYREFTQGEYKVTTEQYGQDLAIRVEGRGMYGILRVMETEIMVLVNGLKTVYRRSDGVMVEARLSLVGNVDTARRHGLGLNREANDDLRAMDDLNFDHVIILRFDSEIPKLEVRVMCGDQEVEAVDLEAEVNPLGRIRGEYLTRWSIATPLAKTGLEIAVIDETVVVSVVNERGGRYMIPLRMVYDTSLVKTAGRLEADKIRLMFAGAIPDYEEVI